MSNYSTFDVKPYYGVEENLGEKIWVLTGTGLDQASYLSGEVVKSGSTLAQADYPELFNYVGHGETTSVFTARTSGTTSTIHSIYYGNGIWVYSGGGGILRSSTDAITWTARNIGTTITIESVIYANGIWMTGGATGLGGDPPASADKISTDLITWTPIEAASGGANSIAYGNGIWAKTDRAFGALLTSTDAINWVSRNRGSPWNPWKIAYGNNLWVWVGQSGSAATSTDASSWTARTTGTTSTLNAISYGNGLWVYGGVGGVLATSTDAITWTARTSGTTSTINSISYTDGLWVYVANGGVLRTSTDAITWTARTSGTSSIIKSIYYANELWVYVGDGGALGTSTDLYTAINATTYTYNTHFKINSLSTSTLGYTNPPINASIFGYVRARNSSKLYGNLQYPAGSLLLTRANSTPPNGYIQTGTTYLQTAYPNLYSVLGLIDPNVWIPSTSGTSSTIGSIDYGNNTWVYAGFGGVLRTSTDAITWTARTSGTTSSIGIVKYFNGTWIYAGPNGMLATSTDAITWTNNIPTIDTSLEFHSSLNGIHFLTGSSGALQTSTNLITWTARTSGTTSTIRIVTYGNGLWMYGGDNGALATSTDAITWTARTSGTASSITAIAYGSSQNWCLWASDNTIKISNNNGTSWSSGGTVNWSTVDNPATLDYVSLAFGNGLFCIHAGRTFNPSNTIGSSVNYYSGGTFASSTDNGVTWTSSGSASNYYAVGSVASGINTLKVKFGNGLFVIPTIFGVVATSTDGVTFTNRATEIISSNATANANPAIRPTSFEFLNNQFIYGYTNGRVGTSTDGLVWQAKRIDTTNTISRLAYTNNYAYIFNTGQIYFSDNQGEFLGGFLKATITSIIYDGQKYLYSGNNLIYSVNNAYTVFNASYIGSSTIASITPTTKNWNQDVYIPISSFASNSLNTIIHTGTRFIAAGEVLATVGGRPFMATSTNGKVWVNSVTRHGALGVKGLSYDGVGKIVGVCSSNTAITSENDGISWSFGITLPISGTLNSITYGNGIWACVGNGGILATSTDAVTWTARTSGTTTSIYSIAYGNGLFVYGARGGVLRTSTDAVTWTARTSGTTVSIRSVTYGNGLWVFSADGGRISTSTNAITWTARTSATFSNIFCVTYANGLWIYGGYFDVGTSTDAITWTNRTTPTDNFIKSIAYANNLWVLVGDGANTQGGAASTFAISNDGISWNNTPLIDNLPYSIKALAYGNGVYLATSDLNFSIFRSTDAITWTRLTDLTGFGTCLTYSNGLFVSGGTVATLRSSTNGTTWTVRQIDGQTGNDIRSIAYGENLWKAVGSGGLIVTSTDAVNWRVEVSNSTSALNSIAYGNKFISVGNSGTLLLYNNRYNTSMDFYIPEVTIGTGNTRKVWIKT